MRYKIPILYAFIYVRLINKNKTSLINQRYLKEILRRIVIRKGGIPNFMIKYLIEDMIGFGLIERLNCNSYRILENDCKKKIQRIISFYI